MLPQHADEHEDGGDEDEGQRDLADGPGGEGLDVALGAALVHFLVPAGEGGEQEEADEGEHDGDDAIHTLVSRTHSATRRIERLGGGLYIR